MPRKVLTKNLSLKGSQLLMNLEQSIQKPIVFYPISDLKHCGQLSSYGSTDFFSSEAYIVWLREDLPKDAFEANLFHELRHIQQVENSFPIVCNKDTELFNSPEKSFFEEIGSHLQSVILDIDVHKWLDLQGYSSEFFIKERFTGLMKNKDVLYNNLDDKYNFANLCLAFFLFFFFASNEQKVQFKDAYSRYPLALSFAEELSYEINNIGPYTPQLAALSMGILIDKLALWDSHYILFSEQKVRTVKEFETFKQSCISAE